MRRLIDADELREQLLADGWNDGHSFVQIITSAPTVDVPQPLTRDGVLAEVARIEAAGDTAVVEILDSGGGRWVKVSTGRVDNWLNPDVPRWNVRVRVETEDVPLTQLIGRTIKGETEAVYRIEGQPGGFIWRAEDPTSPWHPLPVDLATGLVTVLAKGEA